MDYVPRTLDGELDALLGLAPAIAIEGPKGVGKTATARQRAQHTRLLDEAEQRALVEADPRFRDMGPGTVLLDEWQRLPQVWDSVRRRVDEGAPPGRFLLTGSATPVAGTDMHSGAGRILSLRMRPMALHERGVECPTVSLRDLLAPGRAMVTGSTTVGAREYFEQVVASGFPGILNGPAALRRFAIDSYLRRIIDRDVPGQGHALRAPETLRRWLTAYAAASSTTTAYSRILDATTTGVGAQPAKTTTIVYRDLLSQLWILDPIPAWAPHRTPINRLQQAAKHQLADPALAASLLRLTADALATGAGGGMSGPLFESLASLSVRVAAQACSASVGHLRTRNGDHEVDLVVEGSEGQVIGIEVKLSAGIQDRDVRHLLWLRDQLGEEVADLVVLTTGEHAYRRPDGVAVVPLALWGP